MATLNILGTSHPLQCAVPACGVDAIDALRRAILEACRRTGARRIVEEMNEEGLGRHSAEKTVGARVARELGLTHQMIDPSQTERDAWRLNDEPLFAVMRMDSTAIDHQRFRDALTVQANEVRERLWVARMLAEPEWPTLFICGSDHVQAVQRLWFALGLDARIVHRDFDPLGWTATADEQRMAGR
jgi:hypothetical protein